MTKSKDTMKKTLSNLWKASRKEFDKMTQETGKLFKKGEKALTDASQKSKETLEGINAAILREKLYYQLGKVLAGMSKSKWAKSRKVNSLTKNIGRLNKEIKKKLKK